MSPPRHRETADPALVSIAIVNWNGGEHLVPAVESALRQTHGSLEVIVVDNASADGSLAALEDRFAQEPRLRLVRSDANLGYCGGMNLAISVAAGEFILSMNPDVVLAADFIERALEPFADPRVGLVAPFVMRASDASTIDSAGTCMFPHLFSTAWRAGASVRPGEETREVFGAIGAYALYRRSALDDVAMDRPDGSREFFDADFFTYYDEHDLQIRFRWRGWRSVYHPPARATHVWRYSVKRGLVGHGTLYHYAFRNYYLSMIKNMSVLQFLRALPCLLLQECGLLALSLAYRRPIVLSAKLSALPLARRMLAKRRHIRVGRRITQREFDRVFLSTGRYLQFLLGVLVSERKGGRLLSFSDCDGSRRPAAVPPLPDGLRGQ